MQSKQTFGKDIKKQYDDHLETFLERTFVTKDNSYRVEQYDAIWFDHH